MVDTASTPPPRIAIERLTAFEASDINDICDAAEAAILEGGGFGWLKAPPRHVFESYWRGVLLVPERQLFVGRLDGVIAGAAQFVRPARNNEAQAHAATLTGHFVAPWGARSRAGARRHRGGRGRGARGRLPRAQSRCARDPDAGARDVRGARLCALGQPSRATRWSTASNVQGHFYTKEL